MSIRLNVVEKPSINDKAVGYSELLELLEDCKDFYIELEDEEPMVVKYNKDAEAWLAIRYGFMEGTTDPDRLVDILLDEIEENIFSHNIHVVPMRLEISRE